LNHEFQPEFKEEKPEELTCPRCKQGVILKGKTSWGCSGYRSGCQLRVPFTFLEKNITQTHLEQLILKGKTTKINGLTLEDGSKQNGSLIFDSNWQITIKTD